MSKAVSCAFRVASCFARTFCRSGLSLRDSSVNDKLHYQFTPQSEDNEVHNSLFLLSRSSLCCSKSSG